MRESACQFSEPKLRYISFDMNSAFSNELYNGFKVASDVSTAIIKENKEAVVNLKLKIGENNEKYPFHIELEIYATFKCEDEGLFDKLVKNNAPALLLSYARPIISLVTAQSGYPAFNLPFMSFVDDNKQG